MKLYVKVSTSLMCMVGLVQLANVHANPVTTPATTTATPTPMRWVVNMGNQTQGTAPAGMLQTLQNTLGVPVKLVRPLLQPDSYLVEMQSLPVLGSLQTPQAIRAALQALPGVRFASPDIQLQRTAVPAPNDGAYSVNQASYMHTGAYASLRMQDVWEQARGSSNVVIAVLDSGVLFDNPELKGRLLPGYDFVSNVTPPTGTRENGTVFDSGSNDGNGRDPDPSDPGDAPPPGFNCPDGSTTSSWHGTTVASVAAAQSNNGQFLAGMDWNAKVLPVRVSGRCGIATSSDIVDAFYWATGSDRVDPSIGVNPNPANVINLSFASDTPLLGSSCSSTDMLAVAIADARARNVAVVVSAGNNSGGPVQYPANCPGTIAVGAAQQNGQLSTYTAKGAGLGFLTLHAPGDAEAFYLGAGNTGSLGPNPSGTTALRYAGTSFSAPMVAGAVSLLNAVRPGITPAEIDNLLRSTALPYAANAEMVNGVLGTFRRNCTTSSCGAGLLNPLAAINAARALNNPLPVANVPQSALVGGDGPLLLDASLSSNSASGENGLTFSWQQVRGNPVVLAGTTSSSLQVQSGLAGNVAEFALTVTDTASNRSNTSLVRLVSSSVDERSFAANGGQTGGAAGPSGNAGESGGGAVASAGAGGGGGALSILGLLGLLALLLAHRGGLKGENLG